MRWMIKCLFKSSPSPMNPQHRRVSSDVDCSLQVPSPELHFAMAWRQEADENHIKPSRRARCRQSQGDRAVREMVRSEIKGLFESSLYLTNVKHRQLPSDVLAH